MPSDATSLAGPRRDFVEEPYVSLFFLHAGIGQSILMEVPGNGWIVVDANLVPGPKNNPTVEALERHARLPSFHVKAAVITHFNLDHYSGILGVLELCERVARIQGRKLREVCQTLVLPITYKHFYAFIAAGKERRDKKTKRAGQAHLRAFLELLPRLKEVGVACIGLEPLQQCWGGPLHTNHPAGDSSDRPAGESWAFTFHPGAEAVIEEMVLGGSRRDGAELEEAIHDRENEFAYVLGVGSGKGPGSLHFLLTSDVPGSTFRELTRSLQDEIVPEALSSRFGARQGILPLIDEGASSPRLWPVQGITVPHHGSRADPARHEELSWWLASGHGVPGQPALAVVQGHGQALGKNTVSELAQAQLRIFCTAKPERLLARYRTCKELDAREQRPLRVAPAQASPAPQVAVESRQSLWYREIAPEPNVDMPGDPDSQASPAYLEVRGGGRGLHRVIAKGVYEIVTEPATVLYHDRTQVFP
ncbi:MAG TPA: hypothetical protein VHG32_02815 [Thermoanaerobaculia bacterium]|jgi:hypothetical protein|nr:hypothetical protein [Thermoanaerobaculia bacterium]